MLRDQKHREGSYLGTKIPLMHFLTLETTHTTSEKTRFLPLHESIRDVS